MNNKINIEKKEQASFWFLYKVGNFFVALFLFILFSNDHLLIGGLGLILQTIFNFVRVPVLIAKFEDRLKIIAFKTQIENIYVFSLSPDQEEDKIVEAFKKTVDLLRQSGNVHEVRVHLAMFGDVNIFTWFYDRSGRLIKNQVWRAEGSASESWEEYLLFTERFEREDREVRLRQLRKDNTGFDWVNENVFNQ
jgi:hypothetical protein